MISMVLNFMNKKRVHNLVLQNEIICFFNISLNLETLRNVNHIIKHIEAKLSYVHLRQT
jgi:hypothetical protein